jgi:phosphate starvation-inducible protein PhoH and related proteins
MSRKRGNPTKGEVKQSTPQIRDFQPKTKGQAEYIRAIVENDLTICDGLAGTGKTACAIATACNQLIYSGGDIKRIVISRPIVETGPSIGFLPGAVNEKVHEYMIPCLEELEDFFGPSKAEELLHRRVIDIVPLNFMRGRNLHNTFLIVDEAQNCTYDQLKMAVSRMGRKSKCVINGDASQSDLYRESRKDFVNFYTKLTNVDRVSIMKLGPQDIVRNPLIAHILEKL